MKSKKDLNEMYEKVCNLLDHTGGEVHMANNDDTARVDWNLPDKSHLTFIVYFSTNVIGLDVCKKGLLDQGKLRVKIDPAADLDATFYKPLEFTLRHDLSPFTNEEFQEIEAQYLKVISEVTLQSRVTYLSDRLDAVESYDSDGEVDRDEKDSQRDLYEVLINNLGAQQYGSFLENLYGTDINMGKELFIKLNNYIVDLLHDHYDNRILIAVYNALVGYGKRMGLTFS